MAEIEHFKLPIAFLKSKQETSTNLMSDLELLETGDDKSLYEHVFHPEDSFAKDVIPMWAHYYTSDKKFIKESQKLYKKPFPEKRSDNVDVEKIWTEITTETGFYEKYQYMDWSFFEKLNNSSQFLQCLSLYNLTSPILSLALPIIFLLIPFLLLKLKGVTITLSKYCEVLKQIFQRHQLGQIFNIGSASWDKRAYICISLVFYAIQVYQNIMSCYRFSKNTRKIHVQLFKIRDYLTETIDLIDIFDENCQDLKTYEPFILNMRKQRITLQHMYDEFHKISPNKMSFAKISQIGHIMKCFYQLYKKPSYKEALQYSFGFNGYISNIQGLIENVNNGRLNSCKITTSKTKFVDAHFPAIDNEPVKNSYNLDKQLIITGPNAAGKTTLLKTTLFNVLLTQQTGYGFYKSASVAPYDIIHSYINIPDTSGRDSLFQAEARRCRNILTSVETSKLRHFCVFDELYSGTNPYEAIGSATSFLKFLNKYKNVSFVLTTHFLDLCKRLDKTTNIQNCHMKINLRENNFEYTYKMQKGISSIKGGVQVLKDLDYPQEIIDGTNKIISQLII